jgi:hypothetical protein
MKNIKGFMVLVLIAFIALAGAHFTMHAGEVNAANPSDSNFKGRYTTSVTITNLEEMVGSGSTGSSGQIKIHDGTDSEWKTVTASGSSSGTLASTGALVLTQVVNTIGTNNIIDNTVSSADILNGTIAADDVSAAAINSPKLDKYTLSLLVANTASTNSVSGDASDLYTGALLTTIGGINGTNLVNDVYHDGFGNFVISMVNALQGGDAVWTLGFINAN